MGREGRKNRQRSRDWGRLISLQDDTPFITILQVLQNREILRKFPLSSPKFGTFRCEIRFAFVPCLLQPLPHNHQSPFVTFPSNPQTSTCGWQQWQWCKQCYRCSCSGDEWCTVWQRCTRGPPAAILCPLRNSKPAPGSVLHCCQFSLLSPTLTIYNTVHGVLSFFIINCTYFLLFDEEYCFFQ